MCIWKLWVEKEHFFLFSFSWWKWKAWKILLFLLGNKIYLKGTSFSLAFCNKSRNFFLKNHISLELRQYVMICLNENDISDWFNHNLFHDFFLIPYIYIYIYIWAKIGKLLPKNNIESSWKCMRQNREISPQEQYWVKLTKYAFSIGLKSQVFLLFNLFLLLFICPIVFFGIIYGSYCTILATF